MSNKKYFWLKLKDDFFKTKDIRKLRMVAGGDTFTIIYLKMQLLSIRNEGIIEFIGIEDSIEEQLALELDEKIDDVKLTLAFLFHNRMIEQLSEEEYLLNAVVESIGSETTAAERMRRLREKRSNSVTMLPDVQESYTEIDIEIEKEIEKELDIELDIEPNSKATDTIPKKTLDKIIDEWNKASEMNIRSISKNTERYRLTKARLGESDNEDEFLKMIEIVSEIPFLQKPSKYDNKQGKRVTFRPSYDWCVVKANYDKILEGAYYEVEDKESDNNGEYQQFIYDDGSRNEEDNRPSPADVLRAAIEAAEAKERNE